MTTDPGLLILRELDHRLGLTEPLDTLLDDSRDCRYVLHHMGALLQQRVYQIAAGYEDAVDANLLRFDPTFQTIVHPQGPGELLATQSTLSRLENSVSWSDIRNVGELSLLWFVRHGAKLRSGPRQEVLLDADSTDDPTHVSGLLWQVFFADGGVVLTAVVSSASESGKSLLPGPRWNPRASSQSVLSGLRWPSGLPAFPRAGQSRCAILSESRCSPG